MLRFLLFLSLLSGSVSGQTTLSFEPLLGGRVLVMNDDAGAGFGGEHAGAKKVEVLRWYLSDLELLRGGKTVFTPKKRHHLLDAEKPASLRLQLATEPNLSYDELRFTLGVDSLTAASGVFGQDLDPTNGMYWTWRSGYINFKLEGTAPECPARKNRFQFHVGGFQGPFAAQRVVRLAVSPAKNIRIMVDLDRFFTAVDLKEKYQVMSPDVGSAEMADVLVSLFQTTVSPEPELHPSVYARRAIPKTAGGAEKLC